MQICMATCILGDSLEGAPFSTTFCRVEYAYLNLDDDCGVCCFAEALMAADMTSGAKIR
jgi:hypothetical protein